MIFKKGIAFIMALALSFSIIGCSKQQKNDLITVANKYQISKTEYTDFFESESDETHDLIFENGILGATINKPNAYYIGKLKDNKVHGLGTSLYIYTYKNMFDMNIYTCELLKGKFIEGKFIEGKQYLFNCYERNSALGKVKKTYKESPLLGDVKSFINENSTSFNLSAEGTFTVEKFDKDPGRQNIEYWKHVLDGNGIIYKGNSTAQEERDMNYKVEKFYDGEFVKGKIVKGKKFSPFSNNETVTYEGSFKDGEYNGEGKLYDSLGKLQYEGCFNAGKYDGKGKLYDSFGKVKYEGEFKNGDIKK